MSYDHLNRLTDMQRGTLNSSGWSPTGISGTSSIEQTWSLDPTGNWSGFVTQAAGTTNLNQTRTNNTVNEITNITESTGPTWVVPAYDAAGNTATMPQVVDPTQSFTAVYDAWNRMVSISASGSTVAQYQYDGRNRTIVKLTYSGGTLSETRHFYFTNNWQDVEERVGASTSMDKQYVWGIRYIDELVCRDDAAPRRLYACQDANFNVTSITNINGTVQERYLHDPYGNLTFLNGSWSVISSSAYSWSISFQGLMQDIVTGLIYARKRYLNSQLGFWLSRDPFPDLKRMLSSFVPSGNLHGFTGGNSPAVGTILAQDPSEYGDSVNLYEFVGSSPLQLLGSERCCNFCNCTAAGPLLAGVSCSGVPLGTKISLLEFGNCTPKSSFRRRSFRESCVAFHARCRSLIPASA